jgi:uncharacterized membrane protein (UPF0127 family)
VSRRLRSAVGFGLVAVAVVALVVGAVKIFDDGGDATPRTRLAALAATLSRATPASAPFVGLTEVHAAVGGQCLRLAVADSLDERVAGLRGTTDLGQYDGMLFVFDRVANATFTMSGVTDPLDIAFFGGDGTRGSSRMMKPCAKAEPACPVYRADAPFVYALETPPGHLPAGPIGPCSTS